MLTAMSSSEQVHTRSCTLTKSEILPRCACQQCDWTITLRKVVSCWYLYTATEPLLVATHATSSTARTSRGRPSTPLTSHEVMEVAVLAPPGTMIESRGTLFHLASSAVVLARCSSARSSSVLPVFWPISVRIMAEVGRSMGLNTRHRLMRSPNHSGACFGTVGRRWSSMMARLICCTLILPSTVKRGSLLYSSNGISHVASSSITMPKL
mmetsp:Transcript_5668/g.21967  ORF Transcript_5668/g.21967 Transcript_5668/m.21967 type:complete len:210 (-) Transcript_5668:2903-3532(-)